MRLFEISVFEPEFAWRQMFPLPKGVDEDGAGAVAQVVSNSCDALVGVSQHGFGELQAAGRSVGHGGKTGFGLEDMGKIGSADMCGFCDVCQREFFCQMRTYEADGRFH